MEERTVSPPKTQRNALQPLTFSDLTKAPFKNRNSIKKKLKIEQENVDYSNIPPHLRASKYYSLGNKSNSFNSIISGLSSLNVAQKRLSSLPYEVHLEILKFIAPEDLIRKVQYINKYWYRAANDPSLWTVLNQNQRLGVDIKYLKQSCIVERRSRGKLYKAISRLNRRPVVVRSINLSVANGGTDDGVPTSILREISYMKSFDHINISKIIEVEVNKEVIQICAEYSDHNLKEYMKQFLFPSNSLRCTIPRNRLTSKPFEYKMPLKTIKSIAYQILKGLSYLHHHGIIHRNLKGDNTLVSNDGVVKISDFALSKLVTVPHAPYTPEDPKDRERSGREARRLWYRAPELLFRKKRYSFETDIWAFGCLLAEIALNEPLFSGDTEIEQLFKVFSLIGSPNASNWTTICDDDQYKLVFPRWETVYFPYICETLDSTKYKQIYSALMPNREKAFIKLQALGNVLGKSGLDLLWNCLSLNPQLRSSANNLLHHNFFDEIHEENKPVYSKISECHDELCKRSMCYTAPESPECHLVSYFNRLRNSQDSMRPMSNYLEQQTALTEHMRCILIDWLIDVSVHFDFLDETLHLCVNYIDRTLSKMKLDKTKLQLVGVTCLKIADVFHERSKEYYKQDNSKEYAYITADEYNPQQLIDMEKEILNLLGFNLVAPNTMHFLKVYIALFQIREDVSIAAMFLADLMLLSYHILEFEYSLVASSVLFLACAAAEFKIDEDILMENRKYVNIHDIEQFRKCVGAIKDLWYTFLNTTIYATFEAIYNKYQSRHLFPAKTLNPPSYTMEDIKNWFY